HDAFSSNIFVGDASGRLSYARDTGSTTGTCAAGSVPCLGATTIQVGTGGAIVDAPTVDGSDGSVIAYNGQETSANGIILQTNTALLTAPSGAANVTLHVGGAAPGANIHIGAFDHAYLTTGAPSQTGKLYVCAKDPTAAHDNRNGVYQLS